MGDFIFTLPLYGIFTIVIVYGKTIAILWAFVLCPLIGILNRMLNQEGIIMFVAASSRAFPQLSLQDILSKLSDLDYTAVELEVGENGVLRTSELAEQFDKTVVVCRNARRIKPIALHFTLEPTDKNFKPCFAQCCKLARALKVVVVTVRSSLPGVPFNEEIERLQNIVHAAALEGVIVALVTETGRISEDPLTIGDICANIKGLGVSLDPSYFIYGHAEPIDYEKLIDHTYHIRLRDTTRHKFQVLIGQGELEYSKLIIQLNRVRYNRSLCADLVPVPDVDTVVELRKMRLLLESLL
jgi:sugar phosphate isomerase/epimerase